jgi:CDP-diacylglycerol---serine O-phosphatidyltransferase
VVEDVDIDQAESIHQPTILSFVRDAANLVTLAGLVLGMVGLAAAIGGELEAAVAFGIWAMVCDSIDGPIARRSRSRTDQLRAFGVQLDSLADIVCSTVLPAIVLVVLADHALPAVAVGTLLVTSGAMRLAYFNLFGRVGGATMGLPVAYTPAVLAVPVLLPHDAGQVILLVLLGLIAILQVMPVRVPELAGVPNLVFHVVSVLASIALLLQP